MRPAIFGAALVAALCLGIRAALMVIDVAVVDLKCQTSECYGSYECGTALLALAGGLALIIMALLAANHAAQQHAGAAGFAFLLLVGLGIYGALAISTSSTLRRYLGWLAPLDGSISLNPLGPWTENVTPALLIALAAVPGLVLSWFPLRRTPPWHMEALAKAALVSLIVASAALGFFLFREQHPEPIVDPVYYEDSPLDVIVTAAPQYFGALALFLATWLLGNITLILSLLRRDHAPARRLERAPTVG